MVRYILLIILQGMGALALAQGGLSFEPVQASGLPYTILIQHVEWNGEECPAGSLIGAFSDSLCVGAAEYESGGNIQLISWAGDPAQQIPGFTPGDSMQFYVMIPYLGNWYTSKAEMQVISGDGCFGWGAYSAVELSITDSSFLAEPMWNQSDIQWIAYPNPFVDFIHLSSTKSKIQQIELIQADGKLLQRFNPQDATSIQLDLRCYPDGLYFLKIYDKKNRQSAVRQPICLIIQKKSAD